MVSSLRRALVGLTVVAASATTVPFVSSVTAASPSGSTAVPSVAPQSVSTQSVSLNEGLSATQVAVGSESSCVLSTGGVVYCWGSTFYGAVGNGATLAQGGMLASHKFPAKVVEGSDGFVNSGVTSIDAGGASACAIKSGSLYCWGLNDRGQLGNNSTTNSSTPVKVANNPAAVPPFVNDNIISVAVGVNATCAVRNIPVAGAAPSGHHVYCWGLNSNGRLRDPATGTCSGSSCEKIPVLASSSVDFPNDGTQAITGVAVAASAQCVITNGKVVCWGVAGNPGVLGRLDSFGAELDTGDRFDPQPVAATGGFVNQSVSAVSGENDSMCAIKGGELFCWGDNGSGQLGNASTTPSSVPVKVSDRASVFTNANITSVSVGTTTACAVSGGVSYCWGDDGFGSTDPTQLRSVLSVVGPETCSGGPCATRPVKVADGEMINDSGATAVGVWGQHACAIKSAVVFCWGFDSSGQLGLTGFSPNGLAAPPQYEQTPWMVYNSAPPTVTAFSPTSFGAGSTVTLTGTNLTSATKVWVGGNSFSSAQNVCTVTAATGTSLTCTFGSGTTFNNTVNVVNLRSLNAFPSGTTPPTYTWTSGPPPIVVGQCENGSLGVKIENIPAGHTLSLTIRIGGATRTLVTSASDYSSGTLSKTFTTMRQGGPTPTDSLLLYGVAYTVGGSTFTQAGNAFQFTGVPITLVDGGSTANCPVVAGGGNQNPNNNQNPGNNVVVPVAPPTTVPSDPDDDGDEVPTDPGRPSLVTDENRPGLVRAPGQGGVVVDGEVVEVVTEVVDVPAAQVRPERRTPAQVNQIRQAANELVQQFTQQLPPGVETTVQVVATSTGAIIRGLVTDANGNPIDVPAEDVVLMRAEDLVVMVGAQSANVTSDGRFQVPVGSTFGLAGTGFGGEEEGEFVVMSTPTLIAEFETSEVGTFDQTGTLPQSIPVGDHTLVVATGTTYAVLGIQVVPTTLPVTGSSNDTVVVFALFTVVFGALLVRSRRTLLIG